MAILKTLWTFCVVIIGGILTVELSQAETLQVVGVLDAPFLIDSEGGNLTGFIPDLLDSITQNLGVDYSIKTVTRYGYYNVTTGEWNGMIRNVTAKEADVAGLLTQNYPRSTAVEFSYPVLSVGPVIVMKRPPKERLRLRDNLSTLFKPFDFTVWLMTILAFFVTSTVLYIISHFNPYEWRRMFKDREATLREAESFTCMNSFWFSLSALAWQGYIRAPRSVGGRLVVTAWWFFVVFLLLSYVASLTNLLRMGPKPLEAEGYSKIRGFREWTEIGLYIMHMPISVFTVLHLAFEICLSDLAKSDNIKVLVIPGGSTEVYFKESPQATEQMIYQKIASTQRVIDINNTQNGIQKVRESAFSDIVIILESATAKYLTQQEPCDLYMVSDSAHLINTHQSFAFAPGSKWTAKFDDEIRKMRESGALRLLKDKWFPTHCKDSVVDSEASGFYDFQTFYKLDLGAFFGAVLILGVGLILGGLATIVEVCIYKWAETRVDDEEVKVEPEPEANEKLLEPAPQRGGATQV